MGRPGGFRSPAERAEYVAAYDRALAHGPVRFEEVGLVSRHGRTHVLRTGPPRGPAIVFLHGRALSSTMWIDTVGPFVDTHHVHLVDVVGDMNKSVATAVLQTSADVDEWMGAVLDRLGLERPTVVGLSYGAWLATTFALSHPERVDRLALISPAGVFSNPRPSWLARAVWVHAVRPRADRARAFARTLVAASTVARLDEEPLRWVFEQYVTGVPRFRPSLRDAPPSTYRGDALAGLTMPTTVLIGADDSVCDGARAAARARTRLPNARVELVSGSNHHMTADRPDVVLDGLAALLAEPV